MLNKVWLSMLIKKERIPVSQLLLVGLLPSGIKKLVYRMKGYKIGKNVSLSLGSVVIGKDVTICDGAKIGFLTMVRGKEIHIGRFVKIGSMSIIDTEKIFIDEDARISEQVFIGGMRTPQSSLRLGKRTTIMQMSYINPTLPIEIGDDSGVGGHCLFFTHGSWSNQLDGFPVKFAPIKLGKKVWLPWRVFLMPGVTIGDNVVIGANSLISSDIPSNSLAAGAPAKVIKSDYPKTPSLIQKQEMLNQIFLDFKEFIEYSGFAITESKNENGFELILKSTYAKSTLLYTHSDNEITSKIPDGDNALLIFSADESRLKNLKSKGWKMVIAIDDKLRIGTSDSGEEMTTFFSRYGVRFDRLD